jgi:DNA-binding CsgD family transcriptional regulator
VADCWHQLANPYEVARARWREAEAILGTGEGRTSRAKARAPLQAAATIALGLAARPMLRELRELAGRAMIRLPEGIDELLAEDGLAPAAPAAGTTPSALVRGVVGEAAPPRTDTFGLSRREHEVLALISEGRTNREIGERLFISQKTVGVHVGNILAKLGVSGRVEAAAVAIRLGLAGVR